MRILSQILSVFLLLCVGLVAGFFLTRELLLYQGKSQLRTSLQQLSVARNQGTYESQCRQLGSSASGSDGLVKYQLRFVSSYEYVTEAVCEGFSHNPISMSREIFPRYVSKVPGTSGFVVSANPNGIEIEAFADEIQQFAELTRFDLAYLKKVETIVAENGVIVRDADQGLVGGGPVTVCEGYGYQCCNTVSHIGMGERILGLTDCDQNCYRTCATRPIILSFNSNPMLDFSTRSVNVRSGETVEFTFVADAGSADSLVGILDFGDGNKLPISGLAGQVTNTYRCGSNTCEYEAKLVLEDNWGVVSAETGISKIKVVVR
jgi:hypothetical protein